MTVFDLIIVVLLVLFTSMGALRGACLVVLMVLLAGLTSLPKKDDWRDSFLVGVFQPLATSMAGWLPASVARQFRSG